MFVLHTKFKNLAAGLTIHLAGRRFDVLLGNQISGGISNHVGGTVVHFSIYDSFILAC
jgi:hypothetical protein